MRDSKDCSNCIRGKVIPVLGDILCTEKGVVTPDYICSRHSYNHMLGMKDSGMKCIDCKHFMLSHGGVKGNHSLGMCGLFSTRQVDGNKRNGCSKFQAQSYKVEMIQDLKHAKP